MRDESLSQECISKLEYMCLSEIEFIRFAKNKNKYIFF